MVCRHKKDDVIKREGVSYELFHDLFDRIR